MPENIGLAIIKEWWTIIMFGVATFGSYIMGRERTRYRISDLGAKIEELQEAQEEMQGEMKDELNELRTKFNDMHGVLVELRTDMKWFKEGMKR